MSSLTDEQRKMIEEKKKAAQAKLAAKFSQNNTPQTPKNNYHSASSNIGLVASPSPSAKVVRINYSNPQNFKSKPVSGTCELTSKDRFTVHVGYHKQLVDTFKTLPSKLYGKYFLDIFTK